MDAAVLASTDLEVCRKLSPSVGFEALESSDSVGVLTSKDAELIKEAAVRATGLRLLGVVLVLLGLDELSSVFPVNEGLYAPIETSVVSEAPMFEDALGKLVAVGVLLSRELGAGCGVPYNPDLPMLTDLDRGFESSNKLRMSPEESLVLRS
jgi:hypothetical protein